MARNKLSRKRKSINPIHGRERGQQVKKYDFPDLIFAFCAGAIMVSILSAIEKIAQPDIKKQAVDRGYAEYIVDSNGKATWQWKEDK